MSTEDNLSEIKSLMYTQMKCNIVLKVLGIFSFIFLVVIFFMIGASWSFTSGFTNYKKTNIN